MEEETIESTYAHFKTKKKKVGVWCCHFLITITLNLIKVP